MKISFVFFSVFILVIIPLTLNLLVVSPVEANHGGDHGAIPLQADPGAIMNYYQQQFWMQRKAPWLYRPVTENDFIAPEEPVIEFHGMDVEAEIVPSVPKSLPKNALPSK